MPGLSLSPRGCADPASALGSIARRGRTEAPAWSWECTDPVATIRALRRDRLPAETVCQPFLAGTIDRPTTAVQQARSVK
jgi:hypothetical protein